VPERDESPLARARAVALRALASRARTAAWIRARLEREGLGAEADGVVAWLAGLGYLDDAAFARARARALVAPGRLGPRLAERRLVAAGVARDAARAAVSAALAEAGGDAGAAEAALCRTLAERRARSRDLAALDARARARLGRFLLGRGFSGSVVSAVLGGWADPEPDA
jgi:regulatory protein